MPGSQEVALSLSVVLPKQNSDNHEIRWRHRPRAAWPCRRTRNCRCEVEDLGSLAFALANFPCPQFDVRSLSRDNESVSIGGKDDRLDGIHLSGEPGQCFHLLNIQDHDSLLRLAL